jgi:hypothetical protein
MSTPATPVDPARDGTYEAAPVEKKVTAATSTAAAVVALITTVLALVENDQLIEGTPDWIPVLISMLIAAGTTFAAGRRAPHTARPDLPINQR